MRSVIKKLTKKFKILLTLFIAVLVFTGAVYSKDNREVDQTSSVVSYIPQTNNQKSRADTNHSNQPEYILLPSINSEGSIQSIGVNKNKEMAVPANIHTAGWFKESVIPGEKGLSIINGHLDGRHGAGIFRNLGSIKAGDTYTIKFSDNTIKTFQVMQVITVDNDRAASVLFSQDPAVSNQLNLITCAGNFNAASMDYSKRIVVTSRLLEDQD